MAVSVPEGTDVTVDEATLTFTSSTWEEAQTVTVSADEDDDALTDDAVELTHEVSGGDYGTNGVSAEPVEVTIVENDTPTLSVSDQRAGEGVRRDGVHGDAEPGEQRRGGGGLRERRRHRESGYRLHRGDWKADVRGGDHGGAGDTGGDRRRQGGRRGRDVHGDAERSGERDAGRRRADAVGDGDDHRRRRPRGDGESDGAAGDRRRQRRLHGGAGLAADRRGDGGGERA